MPVWLVTGTSQGIGLELTKQLAKNDANTVIATCRAPARATGLAGLAAARVNVHIVALDVLSNASVHSALSAAQTILGERGVDYLINNAGIGHRVGNNTTTAEMLELMFQTHIVVALRVFPNGIRR
ncbi:NAD(P)-binding protein [Auricularia subglabra TFB-10046 SS5]|uniref:NAD(P)-binding protein n=1 Tax=Auricularia subglabra (strain TFB-10046 / SS5) TaxID=717982 RepID=J0DAT2_AURST|nr:NAD(P)-binding protein [Auricularia subglabra TFB-10046 SS5]